MLWMDTGSWHIQTAIPSLSGIFYNIPEAETVVRGSLIYKGNPEFIQALAGIGWLDQEEKSWLKPEITWAQIQQKLVNAPPSDERYAPFLK
jgi:saccharopine dehydrogenase-like NADP-dependent oxidoreductase